MNIIINFPFFKANLKEYLQKKKRNSLKRQFFFFVVLNYYFVSVKLFIYNFIIFENIIINKFSMDLLINH